MREGNVKALTSGRALLDTLRNEYPGKIITDGYLRLEQSLQAATTNTIQFNVGENVGNQNVTERRLKLPDAFVITRLTLALLKIGTSASVLTQSDIPKAIPEYFPNPTIFIGGAGVEAANLNNLYAGYFTVRVGTTTYIDSMDVMRFYRPGTSQQGVGSTATNNLAIGRDEQSTADWGFYNLVPTITLKGKSNNDLSITMPTALNMAGTASWNEVVLMARGFLVQDGDRDSR